MERKSSDVNDDLIRLLDGDLVELFDSIRKLAVEGSKEVTTALKAIFYGSPPEKENSGQRRLETFKFSLNLLQTVELPSPIISELLSLLMGEVESFQTSLLVKLAEYFESQIKEYDGSNTNWLEIFPLVLNALSARDTIVCKGKDMSGADLKNDILLSLWNNELAPQSVMQLLSVLDTVEFSNDEIKMFVDVMLSTLQQLKYQELPSYIYQLLHFPTKIHRKSLLQGIILYFVHEDMQMGDTDTDSENIVRVGNSELYRQIEGSVIVMIQLSCRQDQNLGQTFISMLKSLKLLPAASLSPFMFSIALALSCIHRYEESVLDLLKSMVLDSFRNKEEYNQSIWMRSFVSAETNVVELIKRVISNTRSGWDNVSQGLVKFGFSLLDTHGPKSMFGKSPNILKPHATTISEQACSLGSTILRRTFWAHDAARKLVFEQILSRVVTKTSSPVSHYIDVLSGTVQGDPHLLLEVLTKLIEILDYLPFLSYSNAVGILKALTPLLKISMPLKDALMLVLRKSLFHRDIEPRKIAVTGYLTILKRINARGKFSLSQSQCSFNSQGAFSSCDTDNSNDSSRSICLEIIGILKRTFVQQAEVKQLLYESLYDVAVKKPELSDIILELLLSQFEKFYDDSSNSELSLNVASCVSSQKDEITLVEPLAHLITSITLILFEVRNKVPDSEEDLDIDLNPQDVLENMLKKVIEKMSEVEIADLNLCTLTSSDDSVVQLRKEQSFQLLAIYEALMEYVLINNSDFSSDGCQELLSLYQKHRKLSLIIQRKKGKLSKGKNSVTQMRNPHVTMRFSAIVIAGLFDDDNPNHQNGLSILRSNNAFVKFALSSCKEKLSLYNEKGKCDGFSENMENSCDYMCSIARAFLKAYSHKKVDNFQSLEFNEIALTLVECLNMSFTYMFSSKNYLKFVSELARDIPGLNYDASMKILKRLKKLTLKALSDTESDANLKEVIPLLNAIEYLCTIPSIAKEEVYEWAKQLCQDQSIDDITISKKLLSLTLTLSQHSSQRMKFLLDIVKNIHSHLGDIENETSAEPIQTINILASETSPNLISTVLNHIEHILAEIEWALKTLKAPIISSRNPTQSTNSQRPRSDNNEKLSESCLDLIKVFHEIVQTALPDGNISSDILKALTCLYKCFTDLCKHYLLLQDQRKGLRLSTHFEKMVKFSGTHLTPLVYTFITFIQNNETVTKKNKSNKGTKDIRTIPPLVFAIELYEQHLIRLSKKTKKNLMSHMKLSTARDFRIDADAIAAMEVEEDNEIAEPASEASNHSDDSNSNSTASTIPQDHHNSTISQKRPAVGSQPGKLSKLRKKSKK